MEIKIPVSYQLGIDGDTSEITDELQISADSFGSLCEWAGSYHILCMGRHFQSYVIDKERIPLPHEKYFPYFAWYDSLRVKSPASSVTGNIGQAIAAAYFKNKLNAGIRDIILLEGKGEVKKRKTPDFLVRISEINQRIKKGFPHVTENTFPEWWPLECKARKDKASIKQAKQEAFLQLLSFWREISPTFSNEFGYGIISTFVYSKNPMIQFNLIMPKNSKDIRDRLPNLVKTTNGVKKAITNFDEISTELNLEMNLYGF